MLTSLGMPKVTLVQVVYNSRRFIEPVFSAMFNQAYKDFNVVAVISGNDDGGKELIQEKFPQAEIIDPGYNIGFAKGHNLVFEKFQSEFFMLVNPDLVMEPDYVEKLVTVFETNPKIGAVTGKLLHCGFIDGKIERTDIIDSTGVTISKSGASRDRGQHEVDHGQYDNDLVVPAVSAAGCMYRRSALEAVKGTRGKVQGSRLEPSASNLEPANEYFDEDFHSYWEDVDLAWRMTNAGFVCRYEPTAIAFHGRGAGSHPGGYKKVFSFIKYHRTIPQRIRELNYRNHLFMYIKNSRWFYPQFFIREFFMLGYIILFEISTLRTIPDIIRTLPKIWHKRKSIQSRKHIL